MAGTSRHRRSSRRTHVDCRREALEQEIVMDQQSTEEIFLENQRCELELELAALNMIYNSLGATDGGALEAEPSWTQDEEEESRDGAPEEHIPDDEDCASLQAQLEQLRLQISESTLSVDERSGSLRRFGASHDKPRPKRARK